MAIMAITTSSSISVKPRVRFMVCLLCPRTLICILREDGANDRVEGHRKRLGPPGDTTPPGVQPGGGRSLLPRPGNPTQRGFQRAAERSLLRGGESLAAAPQPQLLAATGAGRRIAGLDLILVGAEPDPVAVEQDLLCGHVH